jgi:hypothetical protein
LFLAAGKKADRPVCGWISVGAGANYIQWTSPASSCSRSPQYLPLAASSALPSCQRTAQAFMLHFLLSYSFGVILMEPWRIAAWQKLGMFAIMFVMLGLWVAAGCTVGGIPAMLVVSLVTKLRQRFRQ